MAYHYPQRITLQIKTPKQDTGYFYDTISDYQEVEEDYDELEDVEVCQIQSGMLQKLDSKISFNQYALNPKEIG